MSLYDKASLVFSGKAAAGKDGTAYNIKPVEKLKVDELVTNGDFSYDGDWIEGTGWSISNGKATKTAGTAANLHPSSDMNFDNNKHYRVTYTISGRTAGQIRVKLGNSGHGEYRSADGTYSEVIKPVVTTFDKLQFNTDSTFAGSIDNVSVREVEQKAVDFTMVRGSNLTATREAPSGLIEKGRENLLTYSNRFDLGLTPGGWGKTSDTAANHTAVVSSGVAGYDGGSSFKILAEDTNDDSSGDQLCFVFKNLSTSGVQTLSFYVRAGNTDYIRTIALSSSGNAATFFDLSGDGAVGHTQNTIDTSIEKIDNYWFRVSSTFDRTLHQIRIYVSSGDGLTDPSEQQKATEGDFIYVMNAQLEQGLVATEYIDTTDSYSKKTAGVLENEPRYDYSGGNAALLLEPERKNEIKHSENLFPSSDWIEGRVDVTVNQTESPEGVVNASKLTATVQASSNTKRLYSNTWTVADDEVWTASVFLKADTANKIEVRITSSTEAEIGFGQARFTASGSGTAEWDPNNQGDSVSITQLDNGWYRCTATGTLDSSQAGWTGSARMFIYVMEPSTGARSYVSDGTEALFVYGAQAEEGSYATSYIPTYGSAATREGDGSTSSSNPMIPGEAFDLTGSFAVFLHLGKTQKTGGSSSALLRLVTPGDIELGLYPNGSPGSIGLNLYLRNQGNYVFNTGANAGFEANESKVCVIYNASTNALAYYINGTVFGSETRELNFGDGSYGYIVGATAGNGTTDFSSEVKELIFFNKVVTPEEAVSLTTI